MPKKEQNTSTLSYWPYGRITTALCLAWVLGVGLGVVSLSPHEPFGQAAFGLALGLTLVSGLAVLIALLRSSRRSATQFLFCLLSLSLGLSWTAFRLTNPVFQPQWPELLPVEAAQFTGVVESVQSGQHSARAVLRLKSVNGKPCTNKVQWVSVKAPLPTIGSTVQLTGTLEKPWDFNLPGVMNQTRYLAEQNIHAVLLNGHDIKALQPKATNLPDQLNQELSRLRQAVSSQFQHYLPAPHNAILGGLVLGNHAIPVDKQTRQNFLDTGLYHLLAASGMNVGIVAASVFWLLKLLRVPFRLRIIISMAAVAFYAGLTGMPASIQRASTMLELALALKLMRRSLPSLVLLALAFVLLLAWQPLSITNVGLQLSVTTTLGLIICLPPLLNPITSIWLKRFAGVVLLPIVAQVWATPLILFYFGTFPKYGVLLNMAAGLVVIPLTTLGFTLASLVTTQTVLGWTWLEVFQQLLFVITKPALGVFVHLVQWGASLPNPVMRLDELAIPAPHVGWVLFVYVALGSMAFLLAVPRFSATWRWCLPPLRRLWIAGLAVGLLLITWPLQQTLASRFQPTAPPGVEWLRVGEQEWVALVHPRPRQTILVAPQILSYWSLRRLKDYLLHSQGHLLNSSLVLTERTGGKSFINGVKSMTQGLVLVLDPRTENNHHQLHWLRLNLLQTDPKSTNPQVITLRWHDDQDKSTNPSLSPLTLNYNGQCFISFVTSGANSALPPPTSCQWKTRWLPSGEFQFQPN